MLSKRLRWLLAIVTVLSLVLAACGAAEEAAPPEEEAPSAEKMKIAFIYIGQPGDLGWTNHRPKAVRRERDGSCGKVPRSLREDR